MSNRFHIIVTSEDGRSSSFQFSKKKLYLITGATITCLICTFVFGYLTIGSSVSNRLLNRKVTNLQAKLSESTKKSTTLTDQLKVLQRNHERDLAVLKDNHEQSLADQQMKFDLENTNLQLENMRLMTTAVSDLNARSELIETVMDTIGVDIKPSSQQAKAGTPNSGGPYIPADEASYDDLLKKADEYVRAIRKMPLGKPISGSISSGYGKRSDPVNGKKSIHEGVDIRGDKGDKVYATASGTVVKAFKNGGYGNYVEIDHGNGYHTAYGHMQNFLVKKGEKVEQGQIIGQVGNTGRSTGPHLHYEILLNNKPINPNKFMKVAELSHDLRAAKE